MRRVVVPVALVWFAGPARAPELRDNMQSYVAADRANTRRSAERLRGMIERRGIAFAFGLFDGETKP